MFKAALTAMRKPIGKTMSTVAFSTMAVGGGAALGAMALGPALYPESKGMHSIMRARNTDFGSPWKGLGGAAGSLIRRMTGRVPPAPPRAIEGARKAYPEELYRLVNKAKPGSPTPRPPSAPPVAQPAGKEVGPLAGVNTPNPPPVPPRAQRSSPSGGWGIDRNVMGLARGEQRHPGAVSKKPRGLSEFQKRMRKGFRSAAWKTL